jgi:hypothetical protein
MTTREADGSDKIAAFERGMTDEAADLAFETPGIVSVIINETFLVAYSIGKLALTEFMRLRLYGNEHSGHDDVDKFLADEARKFKLLTIIGLVI